MNHDDRSEGMFQMGLFINLPTSHGNKRPVQSRTEYSYRKTRKFRPTDSYTSRSEIDDRAFVAEVTCGAMSCDRNAI